MTAAAGGPVVIVLAAGGSQRLGRDKLLEDLGGLPMLQRTVACYTKASRVGDVLIVVGPGEKATWAWLASLRVHLIENPHPGRGMISSIRVGLGSAWAKGKDFLLAPADVPFVKPEVVDKLLIDFRTRSPQIVIPTYKGLGGHPGVYAASVQPDFFMHGDTSGAKEILLRHRGRTLRMAVPDPDVCFDIDTEADLRIAMDPGARWAHVETEAAARTQARHG